MISSVDIFTGLSELAGSYARDVFNYLLPMCRGISFSFTTIWFAVTGFGIMQGKALHRDMAKQFFWLMLIHTFLSSSQHYWEWVYEPVYQTSVGLTQGVVAKVAKTPGTMKGMLRGVDKRIQGVLENVKSYRGMFGWANPVNLIFGWLFGLIFFLLWFLFLSHILGFIFKLMAVSAIAPLLITVCVFKSMRQYLFKAFSLLAHGCLTMVFAGIAMGFTIFSIQKFIMDYKFDNNAEHDIWTALLVSCIALYFHWEAPKIAASILGAHEHHGGAGAMFRGLIGGAVGTIATRQNARRAGQWGMVVSQKAPIYLRQGAAIVRQRFRPRPTMSNSTALVPYREEE